jgi:hypothetical protein
LKRAHDFRLDEGASGLERARPLCDAPEPPGRSVAALRQLQQRLERGGGARGKRLAELALQAGITPPARHFESIALWTELARENASLRRAADKLMERSETLGRRIRRTKARAQALRVKLVLRRLGLNPRNVLQTPFDPRLAPGQPQPERTRGDLSRGSGAPPKDER